MSNSFTSCQEVAAALVAAQDPELLLREPLPFTPLDLLIALHQEVTGAMLSDLARAQRAAAAAQAIARRHPDDPLVQAQAHWSQGTAILFVPDYVRALEHYDAALVWYERACRLLAPDRPARDIRAVHVVRVFCLSELGRYHEAQLAVESAECWLREHPNDYIALRLLNNRNQLAGTMGEYAQMLELADATIELADRMGDFAEAAKAWINRAYACIYLGRFGEAAAALDQGIAHATQAGESITIARAQWNRARLLRCQGRLFNALTELRAAQRGIAQASGEAPTIAVEEAVIYEQLRQLPEAQLAARFAAEQFAQQAMPAYSAGAALLAARIAMQQREVRSARRLLATARAQAQQLHVATLDAEIILTKSLLAALPIPATAAGNQARMRRAAYRAAAQAVTLLEAHGATQEAARGRLTVAALAALLGDMATALDMYRSLTHYGDSHIEFVANAELGALLPPAEALTYLERAATLSVELRRALPMEELQARYSGETSPFQMRLAACYFATGAITQAVEHVWAAKAGPLLDLRTAAGELDAPTREIVERAKADIARWREQARDHAQKARDAALQQQHEPTAFHTRRAEMAAGEIRAREQTLTSVLRTLGDRNGQARVPSLIDVQAALLPGQALLEYAQWGDDLICFLVQPERSPQYYYLGAYRALAPLLDRWNLVCHRLMNDLSSDAERQIRAALRPFWHLLLAPLNDHLPAIKHLLVAPTGMLHHVPWAALSDGGAYLSEYVSVTLTPSGGMWAATIEPPSLALAPPRLLGYAGSGTRRLIHVNAELAAAARLLPDAQVFPEANAADLRAQPPPQLLHIAAHGLSNPSAPLCSTLELADGPFLLLEAHRLNLRGTQLVVLSACETSVRPDHGDMTLALAGAFLCAGARAVLASLWRVADAATAALMEHFYSTLAMGLPPATALQRAQQYVRAAYPLDWAAFQLWSGAQEVD